VVMQMIFSAFHLHDIIDKFFSSLL